MKKALLGELSPFAKLVFVILLVLSGFILSFLAGILLAIPLFHINLVSDLSVLTDFSKPGTIALLKYLQIIQSVGFFIIPSLFAGFLFTGNAGEYLKLNRGTLPAIFLLVVVIMFVCLPMINWMVAVNESMKLPASLQGFEDWMKEAEDQAAKLTEAFLNTGSIGGLMVNLFMIAILPAIGEEMLFRGVLQRLFAEWFRNVHAGIIFTAIVFGAIHLQFYGILPRIFLGIMFGYLFYWSGSLWVPMFAHFLNNGAAVIVSFLVNRGAISSSYEDFGSTDNFFLILGSFVITSILFFLVFRKRVQEMELIS
jgi:uncharacterized protein